VPVIHPRHIDKLQELVTGLRAAADEISAALAKVPRQGSVPLQRAPSVPPKVSTAPPLKSVAQRDISPPTRDGDELHLKAGARRLLQTLAQRYPTKLTRAQLGTLARFTPSGGTFGTYFATLKRQGLLTETAAGEVEITQAGLAYLGSDIPPQPQTTAEVLAIWRHALRAGEWRMLEALVTVYPDALSREELGEHTGFTPTGGTFGTYLGTLRRNGLIEVNGDQVRASRTLFLEG
jgi:hypothetical protein